MRGLRELMLVTKDENRRSEVAMRDLIEESSRKEGIKKKPTCEAGVHADFEDVVIESEFKRQLNTEQRKRLMKMQKKLAR